jgi:type III restriction enzyme
MNHAMTDDGMFNPEYAEVYGVPFSFIPGSGGGEGPDPAAVHRVRALPDREGQYEITFPRLEGYRYDLEQMKLEAKFDADLNTVIENIPTKVTVAGVIGGSETHTLESLKEKRTQEVVYHLTKYLLDRNYVDEGGGKKYWLFPQLKRIVEEYVTKHVVLKDNMHPGFLLLSQYTQDAITKIQQAITKSVPSKKILPILTRYDHIGSTKYVEFATTKPVYPTVKSHINYVVADTETWEQGVAKKLEDMDEVESYVKNQGLDFYIPYEYRGMTRSYMPDFIAQIRRKDGNMLNLLIEVTGERRAEKKMKVDTARNFWVPAVNNSGEFGEWAFLEIQDIHETQNLIRYGLVNGFNAYD